MRIFYKTLSIENEVSDVKEVSLEDNARLVDLLLMLYPQGFGTRTNVYVNEKLIELENYDMELSDNDVIFINHLPQWMQVLYFIIQIVLTLVISYIMKSLYKPKNNDSQTFSSIYSSQIDQIISKVGEPFPIQYGRLRRYPNLIAPVYNFYYNNEEYSLIHTTLGVGNFEIYDVFLDKTSSKNMATHYDDTNSNDSLKFWSQQSGIGKKDINKSIKQAFGSIVPGDFLNYITHQCKNITGLQFNQGASVFWHTINDKGTKIDKVLINISFTNGLYTSKSDGGIDSCSANIQVILIEIDDDDNETGFRQSNTFSVSSSNMETFNHSILITKLRPSRYKIGLFRK